MVKITRHSIHAVVLGFSAAVIGVEKCKCLVLRYDVFSTTFEGARTWPLIHIVFTHFQKRGEEVFFSVSYRKHKIKVGLRNAVKR